MRNDMTDRRRDRIRGERPEVTEAGLGEEYNRWTLFSLGSYARLFVLPFGSSFVIPSRRASPVRACNEGNPRDTTVGRG